MVPLETVGTVDSPDQGTSAGPPHPLDGGSCDGRPSSSNDQHKSLDWMEPEPGDPKLAPTKHECSKLVTRINKDLALYGCLAMGLGSMGDSYTLREELRLLGVKLFDMVQLCKRRLMPLVMSKRMKEDETADLDRLYRIFAGCLELLQEEFLRAITLQASFPLWDSQSLLIQTGISDNLPFKKLGGGLQELSVEERKNLEQEEFQNLEKKVSSLQEISYSASQFMDIKPWDVPIDRDHTKIDVETSDADGTEDQPQATTSSQRDHRSRARYLMNL